MLWFLTVQRLPRTRAEKIYEIPDQLGPGSNKSKIGPTRIDNIPKTPGPNNFLRLRLFLKPNELRIDRYCLDCISRKSLFGNIARSQPNIVCSFFEKGFSRVIGRHPLPGTRRLVNITRLNIGRVRHVQIRKP